MSNALIKGSGCGTREWREDLSLENTSGTSVFKVTHVSGNTTVGGTLNVTGAATLSSTLAVTGAITPTGGITRTSQKYLLSALNGKVGATSGWVITGGTNVGSATLPALQTGSTLVIPVPFVKVGWIINSYHLLGQIESAGGTVTVDCALRKTTTAAADLTDALVTGGGMTQLSVTADTAMSASNTSTTVTADTVAADEMFYFLITATTAVSTDIDLQGVALTVTES